jgi:hypothetical protein
MNKHQPQVDPNDVWNNVELYTDIGHELAKKLEKGLDMAQKVLDTRNLVTIGKTIGTKFETIGNAIDNVAGNKGIIDILDTIGDTAGFVGCVLESITDIGKLAQDKNNTPWNYFGADVKAAKNVTDKIPILDNIMHITDFSFNGVNEAVEMAKNKHTN